MTLHTDLCRRLGIDVPVLLSPMAGSTDPRLVAAVSEAGGLGGLGGAGLAPERLRAAVREIRELTDRPFNVNLFTPNWDPYGDQAEGGQSRAGMEEILRTVHDELDAGPVPEPKPMFGPFEEQLAVLCDEQVPVVSFHFGAQPKSVAQVHQYGGKVLSTATTVPEALALEAAGVFAVVAQGSEAGGHRGTFDDDWRRSLIGTLALVPLVVDALQVPVIAAGGIGDGRGLAASLALGAQAVQLGTAFLRTEESPVSAMYREQLQNASAADTVVTASFSGRPARGLRNTYQATLDQDERSLLPYPAQYSASRKVREEAIKQGRPEFVPHWSGQGLELTRTGKRTERAGALVQRLMDEARSVVTGLSHNL